MWPQTRHTICVDISPVKTELRKDRSQIIQGHYHLRDVPLGKLRPSQINVGLLRRLIQPFLV